MANAAAEEAAPTEILNGELFCRLRQSRAKKFPLRRDLLFPSSPLPKQAHNEKREKKVKSLSECQNYRRGSSDPFQLV
jgi:hypothetical protein